MKEKNMINKKKDEGEGEVSDGNGGEAQIEEPENISPETAGSEPHTKDNKEQTIEKLQAQLEEKVREAAENYDKWLRLRADMENFKKRTQKEKADLIKFDNENLLQTLLPVLDNLERAMRNGENAKEINPLLEGIEIVHKQFLNNLEKFGVKSFSAVGEIFDPGKHEAVSHEESDQEVNRVTSEIQKGYFLHGRLLRPAKVVVSKAKTNVNIEGV